MDRMESKQKERKNETCSHELGTTRCNASVFSLRFLKRNPRSLACAVVDGVDVDVDVDDDNNVAEKRIVLLKKEKRKRPRYVFYRATRGDMADDRSSAMSSEFLVSRAAATRERTRACLQNWKTDGSREHVAWNLFKYYTDPR